MPAKGGGEPFALPALELERAQRLRVDMGDQRLFLVLADESLGNIESGQEWRAKQIGGKARHLTLRMARIVSAMLEAEINGIGQDCVQTLPRSLCALSSIGTEMEQDAPHAP